MPVWYSHEEWRPHFDGVRTQLQNAIVYCLGDILESRFNMLTLGQCLKRNARHEPAASLIVEVTSLGAHDPHGGLIEELVRAPHGSWWSVFVLPFIGTW